MAPEMSYVIRWHVVLYCCKSMAMQPALSVRLATTTSTAHRTCCPLRHCLLPPKRVDLDLIGSRS